MKRPLSDRLAPLAFGASIAVLGMVYGTVSSWWGWFPAPQIGLAHRTMVDLSRNWRNDFAFEPTRHLVAPDDSGTAPDADRGFEMVAPDRVQPGYTLVAGLNTDPDGPVHAVRLYDAQGIERHVWPIRYGELDPETRPQNVMLHGMEVFEDGSLAVTFDAGQAVARVDACGDPIWNQIGSYHHSLARDGAGRILSWRSDIVVWLDEETGEEVESLDLREEIVPAQDGTQRGYLDIRTISPETAEGEVRYAADPFHPNDAEPLRAEMADAFPMFEAGDVLISLREVNLVAVVDPGTGLLKWWQHGPWMKQHDPDFEPDGTISIYDNATGADRSRILSIDPESRELEVLFEGSEAEPFYSWRRGKHQTLPNGNILISEPEHGRVLEVGPDGEIVWQRHMVWDDTHNVIVTEARHVPEDFFTDGVPSCNREVAATR